MPSVNIAAPPPLVLYTSGHEVLGLGRLHVGLPSMATRGAPTAMPTTPTTSELMATARQGNIFFSCAGGAVGSVTGGVGCATTGGGVSTFGGGVSTFGGGGGVSTTAGGGVSAGSDLAAAASL